MDTCKFTFKIRQFLSFLLSFSLVFSSMPAEVLGRSFLAPPACVGNIDFGGTKIDIKELLFELKEIYQPPRPRVRHERIFEICEIIVGFEDDKKYQILIDSLKSEMEDNKYLCLVIRFLKNHIIIPDIIKLLGLDLPVSNKVNMLELLTSTGLYNTLHVVLEMRPELKSVLFNHIIEVLKSDFEVKNTFDIRRPLSVCLTSENVSTLMELYNSGNDLVKDIILGSLTNLINDEIYELLVKGLESDDIHLIGCSLYSLRFMEDEVLTEYLNDHEKESDSLVVILGSKVNDKRLERYHDVLVLLGKIDSLKSVRVLIKELKRQIKDENINFEILRALISAGSIARQELLNDNLESIQKVDALVENMLLNYDFNENVLFSSAVDIFAEWLLFLSGKEELSAADHSVKEYYAQQLCSAVDSIIKLKEYIILNPDRSYTDYMKFMRSAPEGMSRRVHIWVRIGVIKYIIERKKIRRILETANELGIKDGDIISKEDYEEDPRKMTFINRLAGYIPEKARIIFLPDMIYLMLDEKSYKKGEGRERSKGILQTPEWDLSLNKLVSFESTDFSDPEQIKSRHTLLHEWQHKFFQVYGEGELLLHLPYKIPSAAKKAREVILKKGVEKKRLISQVVNELKMQIMFRYQSEILAYVINGDWYAQKDITWWIDFYKPEYIEQEFAFLFYPVEEHVKEEIIDRVFSEITALIQKHKPDIDALIAAKTREIQAGEKLQHDLAFEKACVWVTTVLSAIPMTKFNRIQWLIEQLEKKERITKPHKKNFLDLTPRECLALGKRVSTQLHLGTLYTYRMKMKDTRGYWRHIPIQWDDADTYVLIGPLVFLNVDKFSSRAEIQDLLGRDFLKKRGKNIIYFVSGDPEWGQVHPSVRKRRRIFPRPFINAYTIPVIASMIVYGCSQETITDIVAGYGILEPVALRLGASHVYAIEQSEKNIEKAKYALQINGFQEHTKKDQKQKVTFIHQRILHEKSDFLLAYPDLELPKRIINNTTMMIGNVGPIYGNLHRWIINAAGAWRRCGKIIVGGYSNQREATETHYLFEGKSENVTDRLEKTGFNEWRKNQFKFFGSKHITTEEEYWFGAIAFYAQKNKTRRMRGKRRSLTAWSL